MEEDFEFINEKDGLKELFFNNAPFTGILISEMEKIPYSNGFAQGVATRYYPCGKKKGEYIYNQGDLVYITEWDEHGILIIKAALSIEAENAMSHQL